MKLILLVVGKTNESWIIEGINEYAKRLSFYSNFEMIVIPDVKATGKSAEIMKSKEGEAILKKIDGGDKVILLDEGGKKYSSRQFANGLQKWFNASPKRLVFVVGGAYGFSPQVIARADGKISLSDMTFTHQMIRPFFIEQLYRAFTILKGEKYHND